MGILDNLQNVADQAGLGSTVGKLTEAANVAYPQELRNLEQEQQLIASKTALLKTTIAQNPSQTGDLSGLRTLLMDHYRHIRSGGNPAPALVLKERIKLMPQYAAVVSAYPQLEQGVAELEHQFLQCTFGYQSPDGRIFVPDLGWTDEQWQQITAAAKDQTPRCWLQSDPNQSVG